VAILSTTDGTQLAYHQSGEGKPLICLPGGPMQASVYLGDLGGLPAHLVRLDLRGTGDSAVPADPSTYRCDKQVDDVEALRKHLGHDRIDLLGHSAGGSLAVLYATHYPNRVGRLVLVAPSSRVVGIDITDEDRRETAELRREEPWFDTAYAAFERIWSGDFTPEDWEAITPFLHGRWDAAAQAFHAREEPQKNMDAAAMYYSAGALDPDATKAALTRLDAPVLLLSGEYDVSLPPKRAVEYAALFPNARLAVQPAAGHNPWLDNPKWFTHTVTDFLD
jgi:pimeloyl-ACP methyl ester carboxylesterase